MSWLAWGFIPMLFGLATNCSDGKPTQTAVAPPARCTLRVTPKGTYVDGDHATRAEAIAVCTKRKEALVGVEDGAADEWKAIEAALNKAHVTIHMRGVVDDRECMDNPLARGCN